MQGELLASQKRLKEAKNAEMQTFEAVKKLEVDFRENITQKGKLIDTQAAKIAQIKGNLDTANSELDVCKNSLSESTKKQKDTEAQADKTSKKLEQCESELLGQSKALEALRLMHQTLGKEFKKTSTCLEITRKSAEECAAKAKQEAELKEATRKTELDQAQREVTELRLKLFEQQKASQERDTKAKEEVRIPY